MQNNNGLHAIDMCIVPNCRVGSLEYHLPSDAGSMASLVKSEAFSKAIVINGSSISTFSPVYSLHTSIL